MTAANPQRAKWSPAAITSLTLAFTAIVMLTLALTVDDSELIFYLFIFAIVGAAFVGVVAAAIGWALFIWDRVPRESRE